MITFRNIQNEYIATSFRNPHLNFLKYIFILRFFLQYMKFRRSVSMLNTVWTITIAMALYPMWRRHIITTVLSSILQMFTTLGKTKCSYAVMMDPKMLIGKVTARLRTSNIIMTLALSSSMAVIVLPNIASTLKYNADPATSAMNPMAMYNIKNMPNISYCSVCLPSARNLAVYLTTALPNPRSRTVRYDITEATRA